MGTRLYVGNLPFTATEDEVRSLFEQDDREVVEVRLITDRETGRPRGFGFVEMSNEAQAHAAIEALNATDFGGRSLTVNEARERTQSAPRGGGGGGRGGYGDRGF